MELHHHQGIKSERPEPLKVCPSLTLAYQSAAQAFPCEQSWATDVRHATCELEERIE